MLNAAICLKDSNVNTGKLSISNELAGHYFNGQINRLIVLNQDRNQIIESYNSDELIILMSSLSPFKNMETGKVQFWLAKRK